MTRSGLRLSPEELAEREHDKERIRAALTAFRASAGKARSNEEAREITRKIASIVRQYRIKYGVGLPGNPIEQAKALDPHYVSRPHIDYLSERIVKAVEDVERGQNRKMAISMPPRAGKSTLTSLFSPLWILRRHPEWDVVMTSYDGGLTKAWARQIRLFIEDRPELGVALQRDGGAGGRWNTVEGGGMYTVSIGGALTGRGAKVLIIDDPVADFVAAHSLSQRDKLWNWWLSVAQTRLEPPYLVIVVMTRWHEDDFVGRLLSPDHEGNPMEWEQIVLSAIADREDDVLGRADGEPLLSPLLDETPREAIARWAVTREQVGSYTFEAMYQQHPAPAKGAIFDAGWWRFWTRDPEKVSDDGRVRFLIPDELTEASWLDSWDTSFKGASGSDYVVGQRWARYEGNRFLIAQQRGRWSFTQAVERMKRWAINSDPGLSPCGHLVHQRLIESSANGPAIIDTLKDEIAGLKPITARTSKEARARAITPEVESGNVYLPHPSDPGNEWVADLLSELRNFPHDVHDDQVDALTQALLALRDPGRAFITNPADMQMPRRDIAAAARSGMSGPLAQRIRR